MGNWCNQFSSELNYTRSRKPILQSPSKYLFFRALVRRCFNFIIKIAWDEKQKGEGRRKAEPCSDEKRLKVTVSWINLIRVDCNFMMPSLDCCRSAVLLEQNWRNERELLRSGDKRRWISWRKWRILITQTTIKPSRFVTFLIYFALLTELFLVI